MVFLQPYEQQGVYAIKLLPNDDSWYIFLSATGERVPHTIWHPAYRQWLALYLTTLVKTTVVVAQFKVACLFAVQQLQWF